MAVVRAGEASSSTSRSTYHVFLSFRGKDTRKAFTDHLYTALVQAGIRTFRDDDEIERGENIKWELQKAIQQSKFSIIVLSKDYASSKWCLDELVMILERKRESEHVVLPVFYDVEPSHVGNQSGSLAEAFAMYEGEFEEEAQNQWIERVKGWRVALKEVADLGGMVLQNQADGHESKFIQKIIKVIKDKLNRTSLSVAPYSIGIDSRAKKVNLWVQDRSIDVGIVAICGMGGIGKTTIAKYVYNLNYERFEGSSFLANIRETSERTNGLVHLQRQLLSDILQRKAEKICNVDEGIVMIKDAICCKRILLIVDDVDQEEQLDAILGMRDWFYPGSKIIITTRHEWLLKPRKVYKVHKVENLDGNESLKLFSWHAFGQDQPIEAYMEYSKNVVYHCEGLPLALQVLGSSLSGKNVDVWKSEIEKLKVIPNSHILKKLKTSYDSLQDDHDKDLFLHITCFFIGEEKDFTVKILDQCDFYPAIGIQNLIDRYLLTIDGYNKLRMHQLIQEMGREIIRQESPKEPGKRSRLWRYKDSFEVLKEKTGTETIEGLILDMRMFQEDKNAEVSLESDAFAKMQKLKVLQLNCVRLSGCYDEFPKRIKWLQWHGFPLKVLPNNFPFESLVALDMSYSNLALLWQGTKFIDRLKILNLSHCHNLAKTPDFSGLPSLERLILKDCVCLIEIHESLGDLEGLFFLNLKDCKNLRKLPENIVMLKFLETLIISGCSNLEELPRELKKMESLKVFDANGTVINQFIPTTTEFKSWPAFIWFGASKPRKSLEISWTSLPSSLVRLSLVGCNLSDDDFPMDLSNLSHLQELDLSNNPICSLRVHGLSKLQILSLISCAKLQCILGLPGVNKIRVCGCESLEKITHQSTLYRLQYITHSHCQKLAEIQGLFKLEPIDKADGEMINNLGLVNLDSLAKLEVTFRDGISMYTKKRHIQGLHEFGIFSTFVPGREVLCWFSNRSMESSICFTVPSRRNLRIKGLNVYSVYALSNIRENWFPRPLFTKISNKTKNLNWIYSPICYGIPKVDGDMVWLSHWPFGNQLEGGDQLHISIVMGVGFQVKECGIDIVYDHEQEENKSNPHSTDFSHEEVIGGDLSTFQVSIGAYFLCLHGFRCSKFDGTSSDDWSGTSWYESLFGDCVEPETRGLPCSFIFQLTLRN